MQQHQIIFVFIITLQVEQIFVCDASLKSNFFTTCYNSRGHDIVRNVSVPYKNNHLIDHFVILICQYVCSSQIPLVCLLSPVFDHSNFGYLCFSWRRSSEPSFCTLNILTETFCCCSSHSVTSWWSWWGAGMTAGAAILCYRFWNMVWLYTSVLARHGFEVMAGGALHLSSWAVALCSVCTQTDTHLPPPPFFSCPFLMKCQH